MLCYVLLYIYIHIYTLLYIIWYDIILCYITLYYILFYYILFYFIILYYIYYIYLYIHDILDIIYVYVRYIIYTYILDIYIYRSILKNKQDRLWFCLHAGETCFKSQLFVGKVSHVVGTYETPQTDRKVGWKFNFWMYVVKVYEFWYINQLIYYLAVVSHSTVIQGCVCA